MDKERLIVITGPTASGKTARAVALAKHISGEIISADSRQIYKGMDLGTGKDIDEYGDITYHLIDIEPAGYKYNLYEYLRDYQKAYNDIVRRGKAPILCGGTGLYVESVLNGISLPQVPENKALREELSGKTLEQLTQILASKKTLHNTTDVDTCKRAIRAIEIATYYELNPDKAEEARPHPVHNAVIFGVDIPREERRRRISSRLNDRLEAGMVEEVEGLIAQGVAPDDLIYYGLEYKFITNFVIGKMSYQQMVTELEIAIHQFAKRQMTWFRGMERRGHKIHWIDWNISNEDFLAKITQIVNDME